MDALELLEKQAAEWGLRLNEEQLGALLRYATLLSSYERANVIGPRNIARIIVDHILDSLSCVLHEPLMAATIIADVGSGGGLPGIPISIIRRQVPTTLIESTGKKAQFLRYAAEELGLENVEVSNTRAEDIGREEQKRGTYDIVTSRAVARLSAIAEYSVPLLEVGGQAIAMKGRLQGGELREGARAAGILGATIAGVEPVQMLPEAGDKVKNLVVIEKVKETPERYPRKPGLVVKRPLGVD